MNRKDGKVDNSFFIIIIILFIFFFSREEGRPSVICNLYIV